MSEGVASSSGAIYDAAPPPRPEKRAMPPEPEPDKELAPRGWKFDRDAWEWVPKLAPGRKRRDGGSNPAPSPQPRNPGSGDREGKDPDPGWIRDSDSEPKKRVRLEDVPKTVKDDIAGLAGLVGLPVMGVLQSIDPVCGGALAANYQQIVDASLPLICRSERVVKWMQADVGGFMDWIGLGIALAPVGRAVWEHHVAKTVYAVRDEHGRVQVLRRMPGHEGDHLTPQPQPEFDYSA